MKYDPCPICFSPVNQTTTQIEKKGTQDYIDCPRCGHFVMSLEAAVLIGNQRREVPSSKVANMSGWIRENQGAFIQLDDIQQLFALPTPTPAAKAVNLLSHFASKYPSADQDFVPVHDHEIQQILSAIKDNELDGLSHRITKKMPDILELCGHCSIATHEEYDFILKDVISTEMKWITWSATTHIRISPKGWEYIESRKRVNPNSDRVFVAMWLPDDRKVVFDDAIEKGIIDAGYNPILITQSGHTNRINDEMITEINRSRFAVSVYYVSGFAKALGLNVIELCDHADRGNLHFDAEHYSFIYYDRGHLARLRTALTNSILAHFPQGVFTVDA